MTDKLGAGELLCLLLAVVLLVLAGTLNCIWLALAAAGLAVTGFVLDLVR